MALSDGSGTHRAANDGAPKMEAFKWILYLDPVSADTGCLRVIPGSHLLMGDERVAFAEAVSAMAIEDVPAMSGCRAPMPVETEPGDVMAFNIRCWHASVGGAAVGRRSLNIDIFKDPATREEIENCNNAARGHAGSNQGFKTKAPYNYSKEYLANPDSSPVRARWLARFAEIGCFHSPWMLRPFRRRLVYFVSASPYEIY